MIDYALGVDVAVAGLESTERLRCRRAARRRRLYLLLTSRTISGWLRNPKRAAAQDVHRSVGLIEGRWTELPRQIRPFGRFYGLLLGSKVFCSDFEVGRHQAW